MAFNYFVYLNKRGRHDWRIAIPIVHEKGISAAHRDFENLDYLKDFIRKSIVQVDDWVWDQIEKSKRGYLPCDPDKDDCDRSYGTSQIEVFKQFIEEQRGLEK